MTLENNNLKKKLTDGSFEELYQNTEDFQKLNCAKNAEGCVLEGLTNKKERDKIGKEGDK